MSEVTSNPLEQVREIARSAYRPFVDRLTFDEHRSLAKQMDDLVRTPGWEAIVDVLGGDFTATAEVIVLTGDFDVRSAGIAAGYDRVLSFPQFVIDTFNERDRMEADAQETQGD